MSWLRLTIETTADRVEDLCHLLEQFDAGSISLSPVSNEALFDEPDNITQQHWQRTAIRALLDPGIDIDIVTACIRNRIGTDNILALSIDYLPDTDWEHAFRENFQALEFGGALTIRPSWTAPAADEHLSIMLDPGLAFGTGKHPTSSLCLEWLARQDVQGLTVIDYGCGSGILSLAAAKLGAASVYAVDIDPQAISAARDNAANNGLADKVQTLLPDGQELPEADILLANILLNTLLKLAPDFARLVRPGGHLVLSGITSGQVQECLDCYSRWFAMQTPEHHNEWSLLHGIRLRK